VNSLTSRELQVIHLLAVDSLSVKQIAESLKISPRTVHFHMQNCYKKLGYEFNARNQTRMVIEYRTFIGV
jgi:DNA-binding NarL/FixJ family response regulator